MVKFDINNLANSKLGWTVSALLGFGGIYIAYEKIRSYMGNAVRTDASWRPEWKRDTVYLHVFPRNLAKYVPNLSPFAVKLETWLRMNNVQYELIEYMGFSSKGQSPFIMFNGEEIPDSNFSIEYLSRYFNIDLYPGLTKSEQGVCRSFLKMAEEDFIWSVFWYRYVHHATDEYANCVTVSKLLLISIGKRVKERARQHGIGRHSNDEIYKIGSDDVRAMSDFLGDKKFFMGDQPTLVDCSMFGALSQLIYLPMNFPMKKVVEEECRNILPYMERIKSTYWKDWDEQMI